MQRRIHLWFNQCPGWYSWFGSTKEKGSSPEEVRGMFLIGLFFYFVDLETIKHEKSDTPEKFESIRMNWDWISIKIGILFPAFKQRILLPVI